MMAPGSVNKDFTIWLDGARSHPKNVFRNRMSFDKTQKFDQLGPCRRNNVSL